jgi:hypothetical protein
MNFCPNCGFDNRTDARFCKQCGTSLASAAPLPMPAMPPVPSSPPSPPLPQPPAPAMFPSSAVSAWLVEANGQRHPVSTYTLVGRGATCGIVLLDTNISTQHATITESGGQWQIADNNSRNGTWVNRARIMTSSVLCSGDEVMLGSTVLRFETSGAIGSGGTTLIDPSQYPLSTSTPAQPAPAPLSLGGMSAQVARGRIRAQPNERQDQPPSDWVRTAITLLVGVAFIGALLSFTFAAFATAAVLICLGGAFLIPLFLLLWAPFQLIFNGIISVLKDDKPVTVVNFQIDDEISNFPMDVTFVRKRGTGGGIAQGDVVEVWGKQQGGAAITASKIRVVERMGQSTSAYIPIKNPWPWWILLILAALVVLLILALAGGH